MTAESVVNKLSMFVVCIYCAVGYRLNEKESSLMPINFGIAWKTLPTFQLNASLHGAKVMKTDDDCNIQLKCQ